MRPAVAITFSVWPYVENVCPPLSYVMAIVTKSALRWRSNASLSLMLLFSQYKTTWLPPSSHCLDALPAKMSKFNSHMLHSITPTTVA